VALDDEHSKRYVPRLLALGYRVIDKSNTYRADPKVPLVAAGVNSVRVDDAVRLVANPNCTTIPLTLALSPLQKEFGLEAVTVSTYQASAAPVSRPSTPFSRRARSATSRPIASAAFSIPRRTPATPCPTTAAPTTAAFRRKSAS